LPEMGCPPGAMRSKPTNTARGTPSDLADLRLARRSPQGRRRVPDFDKPRCREASRPAGPSTLSLRTLRKLECAQDPWRPARPRLVRRSAAEADFHDGVPRAGQRTGAMARARVTGCLTIESAQQRAANSARHRGNLLSAASVSAAARHHKTKYEIPHRSAACVPGRRAGRDSRILPGYAAATRAPAWIFRVAPAA
jgi:hypothetical protein